MLPIGEIVSGMFPRMVWDVRPWIPRGFISSVLPGGCCLPSKDQENGEVHRIQIQSLVDWSVHAVLGRGDPPPGLHLVHTGGYLDDRVCCDHCLWDGRALPSQ